LIPTGKNLQNIFTDFEKYNMAASLVKEWVDRSASFQSKDSKTLDSAFKELDAHRESRLEDNNWNMTAGLILGLLFSYS
jgi:hypothetical protein